MVHFYEKLKNNFNIWMNMYFIIIFKIYSMFKNDSNFNSLNFE